MESKEFFKHDSNARNSTKILRIRDKYEAAGYGVYFMLLERLRSEEQHISERDYKILARDIHEDPELIRSVVEDFDLFEFTEDRKYFYSEEFCRRLDTSDDLRAKRAEAGRKGAQSRWNGKNRRTMALNGRFMASDGKTMANYGKMETELPFTPSESDDKIHLEMAQNGKIIANNNTCHIGPADDMAKLWQNPAQNGKEWQNGGKEREEEKEIYKEKEKKSFFSKRKSDLPSPSDEEKREKILSVLFFRNYAAPSKEYERLVAYNGSERWAQMSLAEQEDAATLWRQQPEMPKRVDSRFLEVWQRIYDAMVTKGVDLPVRMAFLDDDINIAIAGATVSLKCPALVHDFIEDPHHSENLDLVKIRFIPFMKTLKANKLIYDQYE